MKVGIVVAVFCICIAGTLCSRPENQYREAFAEWKRTFNKDYQNAAEEATRFAIFKKSLDFVEAWNAVHEKPYTRDLGEFSDLTTEEWVARHSPKHLEDQVLYNSTRDVASFAKKNLWSGTWTNGGSCYDWSGRYCGSGTYVPSTGKTYAANSVSGSRVSSVIEQQGRCNTCSAFAAMGALESCIAIKTGTSPTVLSRQQAIDYSKGTSGGMAPYFSNGETVYSYPECLGGGSPYVTLSTTLNSQNPPAVVAPQSVYPYNWITTAAGGTCPGGTSQCDACSDGRRCSLQSGSGSTGCPNPYTAGSNGCYKHTAATILGTGRSEYAKGFITGVQPTSGGNQNDLLSQLQQGPTAVCWVTFEKYANGAWKTTLPQYYGGVFTPNSDECLDTSFNAIKSYGHCALAVGYAIDGSGSYVHYFIKNQWGSGGNSEGGYLRIHDTRNTGSTYKGTCGISGYYARPTCAPALLNFDCVGATNSVKTGKAATGYTSQDQWNTIRKDYQQSLVISNPIVYSDGTTATGVSLEVDTFSGSYWDNPGGWNNGIQDVMYKRYIYTDFSTYMTFKVKGLMAVSYYDVYLYGKAYDTVCGDQNTVFNVKVMSGTTVIQNYGDKQVTTQNARPWDSSNPQPDSYWSENYHYVKFTVTLTSGQDILITATRGTVPAGCPSKPAVNGFQLQGFI